jgi:hypothetical protein
MPTEIPISYQGKENMEDEKQKNLPGIPPYPPSWFNKFSTWVSRLPGPSWVAYLVIVLLIASVGAIIQMLENPSQSIVYPPIAILTFFQIGYVLSLMDFLDKRAESALEEFRPVLIGDKTQYLGLKIRLTTLPSRPIIIVTMIVFVLFTILGIVALSSPLPDEILVSPSVSAYLSLNTPSGVYSFLTGTLLWLVNGIFISHTFHQLKAIDYAYTQCAEINLFRQNELYAFSNVSAATAIGLVLSSPVWMILDPGLITTIINIIFAILAIIIFVSPLLGVHNLLKNQKDALLKNSLQKKETLILELFSRIEDKNLTDIENYERALSSLEKAHNEIVSISTWPWKTETIRQMVGALFLPVSIWMIQFYLNQLLTN